MSAALQAPTLELYPAQQRIVDELAGLGPNFFVRALLAADTGTGKSAMAIRALHHLGALAGKVLIISPAIQRLGWRDEITKWALPHALGVGVIEYTRERKLPKRATQQRDLAYASRIQIVSYALLGEVLPTDWDAIVVDECHNIGSPLAKQSRLVAALVAANPTAHLLFLSATPIPTLVRQVWHPLYLLQGEQAWGRPSATGDISWQFAARYCGIIDTEYGKQIANPKPDSPQVARLREDMSQVTHRLTMAQVAPDMPPVRVTPLHVRTLNDVFFREWLQGLEADVTHAVVFTHLKATASRVAQLAKCLGDEWPISHLDGETPAGKRAEALARIAASPRHLLVATYDSLSVGIRLLWPQKALVCEFSSSPKTTAQVIGRFAAVGDTRRPQVQIAVRPCDEHLCERLIARLGAASAALGKGGHDDTIEATFGQNLGDAFDMFEGAEEYEAPAGWESDDD